MSSLLAGLVLPAAMAAAASEAVVEREAGVLRLVAGVDASRVAELDQECGDRDSCSAFWNRTTVLAEAQVVVLDGVAVYAHIGRASDRVAEANYRGVGPAWGGGVRGSIPLPMASWYLAAEAGMSWAWGQGGSLDSGEAESAWAQVHHARAVLAWGRPSEGPSLWAGVEASWFWAHHVLPLGYSEQRAVVDLPLQPSLPASAVLGVSLGSQDVGPAWSRSVRLTTGVGVRYGQVQGISAWVGGRY